MGYCKYFLYDLEFKFIGWSLSQHHRGKAGYITDKSPVHRSFCYSNILFLLFVCFFESFLPLFSLHSWLPHAFNLYLVTCPPSVCYLHPPFVCKSVCSLHLWWIGHICLCLLCFLVDFCLFVCLFFSVSDFWFWPFWDFDMLFWICLFVGLKSQFWSLHALKLWLSPATNKEIQNYIPLCLLGLHLGPNPVPCFSFSFPNETSLFGVCV